MRVSYQIASEDETGGIGVDEWPRVWVRNGSRFPIVATFTGHGCATNPTLPAYPSEMTRGVDDSPLEVAPGATVHADLGKRFGEVLAVFNGAHVTSFVVQVSVSRATDDAADPSSELTCSLAVTHTG